MPTLLTPAALKELEDLLRSSRRQLSEIYREHSSGLTVEEMAQERGHSDTKRIRDHLSALRILFGHEMLPKQGRGRQTAIYEADYWLNGDRILSDELTNHLQRILKRAGKTNLRQDYQTPQPPPRPFVRAKQMEELLRRRDALPAVYVVTKKSFLEVADLKGEAPLVKIGWSTKVWDRLSGAQTWDPDPIEVLRVYPCANPNTVEAKIHICLDTLGLAYDNGGGKEWFQADLELIDQIAKSLGLQCLTE